MRTSLLITLLPILVLLAACAGKGAKCGDGVQDSEEQCDDGNKVNGDGCSSICRNEGWCGNDLCEEGEAHTCPTDCAICGNGQCDEGETVASCTVDCYCTNGTCDSGENATICPQDCTTPPTCGNGQLDGGEACDGNNLGGKTCLSQGFDGGTLSCNANCTLNTAGCTSSTGCTIVPQSGCQGGQKCTVDTASANRCITAGAGTDGSPCAADADCAAGLGCAVVNAFTSEGACRRFCRGKTASYDSLDCHAGAGSTCYYGVSDASNTVIPNLFQCTANCDPLTGNGCLASMKCNLYGVDRNSDGLADLFTSECYATADTNYYCEGPSVCPQGYECFNFGYGQACYRWCSTQNTYTCNPLGLVCRPFPEGVVIGGVEYGYCDY